MQCEFAFLKLRSEEFIVLVRVAQEPEGATKDELLSAAFRDENEFIELVVSAALSKDATVELMTNILLAASDRLPANQWLSLEISQEQQAALGVKRPVTQASFAS